jgi:hypothetical protein
VPSKTFCAVAAAVRSARPADVLWEMVKENCVCDSAALPVSSASSATRRARGQLVSFSLHDVEHVAVLPLMQVIQTLTHRSNCFASYALNGLAMQTRCSSVYSGSFEQLG